LSRKKATTLLPSPILAGVSRIEIAHFLAGTVSAIHGFSWREAARLEILAEG
jgi:hypothetical protein